MNDESGSLAARLAAVERNNDRMRAITEQDVRFMEDLTLRLVASEAKVAQLREVILQCEQWHELTPEAKQALADTGGE
jgi:hypothetical protein